MLCSSLTSVRPFTVCGRQDMKRRGTPHPHVDKGGEGRVGGLSITHTTRSIFDYKPHLYPTLLRTEAPWPA